MTFLSHPEAGTNPNRVRDRTVRSTHHNGCLVDARVAVAVCTAAPALRPRAIANVFDLAAAARYCGLGWPLYSRLERQVATWMSMARTRWASDVQTV